MPCRDRRHRQRRRDARPPLPPSRRRSRSVGAHDYAEKLRACHVIVDQDERRAIIRDARARAGRRGRADAGRGRGAGRRECRAHRMAGAAARPLRRGFPRRAARGDPAHRAREPEIFRLPRRRRASSPTPSSAPPISTRPTAARRSSRATARSSPRGCRDARFFYETGPQGAARGAGEEARRRSSSTRSSAPSPTRSSASRSWRAGWWKRGSSRQLPPARGRGRSGEAGCLTARRSRTPTPDPSRGAARGRSWPTSPNAPRGSPRPTSSPAWSASSPSCRA